MSDSTRDLLVRGVAAAKAGDRKEALFYLDWLLRLEPPLHQRIDAWYWMSELEPDVTIQREYLEKILVMDPAEGRARRKLAILDGKLDPGDIIDPDHLTAVDSDAGVSSIERFTCPQCGGRMTYSPDGKALVCEYCQSRQKLLQENTAGEVQEMDFHVALATRQGHLKPAWAYVLNCSGCGVELILESKQASYTCPYCNTAYAIEQIENRQVVLPEGILPMELSAEQAESIARNWIETEINEMIVKPADLHPIYLPVYTFDLGGLVSWQCQVKKDRKWITLTGQEIVYHNDMPFYATHKLPQDLQTSINSFDLAKMAAFDIRYLAGVQAENYQSPPGDVSLQARKAALEEQRMSILSKLPAQAANLQINSSKIIVEAFRLILVPAYLVYYDAEGLRLAGIVNGQNGAFQAQKPPVRKKSFFESLFG
jgi:predicted RNA-binding Zn-ribbon protein involved in translation (DUF1610 family)